MEDREILARALCKCDEPHEDGAGYDDSAMTRGYYLEEADACLSALRERGRTIVPMEPTEEMLNGARDWSFDKYGKPIGNDGALGCWRAMLSAASSEPTP